MNQPAQEYSIHYYFDLYSKGLDSLYREPKDGMISIERLNNSVKLITLVDLSTLWEDKQILGRNIANSLANLNHPNLLNITSDIIHLDNKIPNGFIKFITEAPDHISSWKSFCKRPISLE
jgi:hypothetical protein